MKFEAWCEMHKLSEESRNNFAGYVIMYSSLNINTDYQANIWQDEYFHYLRMIASLAGSEA